VVLALVALMPMAPLRAVEWPSDAEPGVRFQVTFGPHEPVTPKLLLRVNYVTDVGGKPTAETREAGSPADAAFSTPGDSGVRIPLQWTVGREESQIFELHGVKLEDEASTRADPWVWAAGAGLAAVFAVTAAHQDPATTLDNGCSAGHCPR